MVSPTREPLPENYVEQLDHYVASGDRGDAVALTLTKAAEVPAEVVDQMRSSPFWPAMEAVAHTLAYDGRVMGNTMSGDPSTLQRWSTLHTPALVIDGGASPAWARDAVARLVEVLPTATRETLDGMTHDVAPEALAPVMRRYLSRVAETRT